MLTQSWICTGGKVTCCCTHGGKCTCALKKEHSLDSIPDGLAAFRNNTKISKDNRRPMRPTLASSTESKAPVLRNSYHKSITKLSDHHRSAVPYEAPARSHTISGNGKIGKPSHDGIPMAPDKMGRLPNTPPRSVTSAPHPVRRAKSEHGSPTIGAISIPSNNYVPPIRIPSHDSKSYMYSPYSCSSPGLPSGASSPWDGMIPDSFPDNYFVSYEAAREIEQASSPMGLGPETPEVDWSTYNLPNRTGDLPMGTPPLGSGGFVPSQPPSHASLDCYSHLSYPDVASSNGDLSEVDNFAPMAGPMSMHGDNYQDALSDFSVVVDGSHDAAGSLGPHAESIFMDASTPGSAPSHTPEPMDYHQVMDKTDPRTMGMGFQPGGLPQHSQSQQPNLPHHSNLPQQSRQPPPLSAQHSSITSSPQIFTNNTPAPTQSPSHLHLAQNYHHLTKQMNPSYGSNMDLPPNIMPNSVASPPSTYPAANSHAVEHYDQGWGRT